MNTFSLISTIDGKVAQIIEMGILLVAAVIIFIAMRFLSNGIADQHPKEASWGW